MEQLDMKEEIEQIKDHIVCVVNVQSTIIAIFTQMLDASSRALLHDQLLASCKALQITITALQKTANQKNSTVCSYMLAGLQSIEEGLG